METIDVVETLSSVDSQEWNALAGGQPFVRHEFLSALIDSGCAAARTGWLPQFLVLRRSGGLAGAMPLFAKSHSYGEYVFDWAWAEAHERHGLDYYPKLLCAVPFTPVRGKRLLALDDAARQTLVGTALELARQTSSLHVLFPSEDEASLMQASGMLLRRTVQFHWRNEGYADFESFLSRMSHSRRKNIRQERRKIREAGIQVRWVEGAAISETEWDYFHRCYRRTYVAHRSSPYLSRDFFRRIASTQAQQVALALAEREGRPVGSALFFKDADTLYGRYWGATEPVPLLHFECCYYQPIDYAIRRGLRVFEGGAQGEHKLFRGLLPVETLSAHWLADARFARAVAGFLERESAGMDRYVNELCEHSPFKAEDK